MDPALIRGIAGIVTPTPQYPFQADAIKWRAALELILLA